MSAGRLDQSNKSALALCIKVDLCNATALVRTLRGWSDRVFEC